MILKATHIEHVQTYLLKLTFNNGTTGIVDLSQSLWGEVFEPLRNPELFNQFRLDPELGTIAWPNGADLAPEYLYRLMISGHSADCNTYSDET